MIRSIAILGAGESGIGAAILGTKLGMKVFLSDAGTIAADKKAILAEQGVQFEENGHTMSSILAMDTVVKSPGIPEHIEVIRQVQQNRIPIISEIEFAFRYMENDAKVVAITGTNGKTTTTLLIHHLLISAGYKAALGGNVGVSLARLVAEGGHDYYVVEVSSFQLDGIVQFRPDIAILLNITPDHLDRYNNDFDAYVSSKLRIVANLTSEESFIYCGDSEPVIRGVAKRKIDARLFAVSSTKGSQWQAYLEHQHLVFDYRFKNNLRNHKIPLSDIALIGKHNMINVMSATLCALLLDVSITSILKGLKTFVNAPHRLELAGEYHGVKYVNDSKATNVDSVYYALDGIKEKIIWIVGGVDKGNDYAPLMGLVREKVKGIVCLGVDNTSLRSMFSEEEVPFIETSSMKEAVNQATKISDSGDVVLMSPACASFDLFKIMKIEAISLSLP